MTVQECFDHASGKYTQAKALVATMGELVKSVRPDFNVHSAYCQLDIIVQYVLLKTSIADGHLSPIEGEFIDKITTTYDVLHLFKDVPNGLNWFWIASHPEAGDVAGVIGEVEKIAHDHMLYFAGLFACVDAAVDKVDFLSILMDCIKDVAVDFIAIDGKVEKAESAVAAKAIKDCLYDPWTAMVQECLKNKK